MENKRKRRNILSAYGCAIIKKMAKKKNEAAVSLGRLGGLAKVPKGTAMMSEEKRREVSAAGLEARRAKAKKKGVKKKA